jgi:hypothetical protein
VLTLVSPKQSHHVMSMYLYKLMIVLLQVKMMSSREKIKC